MSYSFNFPTIDPFRVPVRVTALTNIGKYVAKQIQDNKICAMIEGPFFKYTKNYSTLCVTPTGNIDKDEKRLDNALKIQNDRIRSVNGKIPFYNSEKNNNYLSKLFSELESTDPLFRKDMPIINEALIAEYDFQNADWQNYSLLLIPLAVNAGLYLIVSSHRVVNYITRSHSFDIAPTLKSHTQTNNRKKLTSSQERIKPDTKYHLYEHTGVQAAASNKYISGIFYACLLSRLFVEVDDYRNASLSVDRIHADARRDFLQTMQGLHDLTEYRFQVNCLNGVIGLFLLLFIVAKLEFLFKSRSQETVLREVPVFGNTYRLSFKKLNENKNKLPQHHLIPTGVLHFFERQALLHSKKNPLDRVQLCKVECHSGKFKWAVCVIPFDAEKHVKSLKLWNVEKRPIKTLHEQKEPEHAKVSALPVSPHAAAEEETKLTDKISNANINNNNATGNRQSLQSRSKDKKIKRPSSSTGSSNNLQIFITDAVNKYFARLNLEHVPKDERENYVKKIIKRVRKTVVKQANNENDERYAVKKIKTLGSLGANPIYEIRFNKSDNRLRVYFFVDKNRISIIRAGDKTSQKKDIEFCNRFMKEYLKSEAN